MKRDPCSDRLPAIVDAAEGHPPPELATHLRACAGCSAALETLQTTLPTLAPLPVSEPGPWLAPSIRRAHEARNRPAMRLWRRLRFTLPVLVPVAATALFLLLSPAGSATPDATPEATGDLEEAGDLFAEFALESPAEASDQEILNTVLAEMSLDLFDDEAIDATLDDAELDLDLILDAFPG